MSDVIVGGDLALGAKELRAEAAKLEKTGDGTKAKRYREAAWHLGEAASWMRGKRDDAKEVDRVA